jgi:exopolysaccharide biosynthesis polyprenyl glycosylphosphotransferase
MRQGPAIREVMLSRDVRAPEILCASTGSRGYLARRYASIITLVFIDVVSLLIATSAVNIAAAALDPPQHPMSTLLSVLSAVALVLVFGVNRLYGLREVRRIRQRRVRAGAWFMCLLLMALIAGPASFTAVLATGLLTLALATAGRELFDFGLRILFGLDPESRRTILLGPQAACEAYVRRHAESPHENSTVLGFLHDGDSRGEHTQAIRSLGGLHDLGQVIDLWRPDELVVVDQDLERRHLGGLADVCRRRRMTLKLVDLEMRFVASGVCLVPHVDQPLFVVSRQKPSGLAWMIKVCADRVTAATLLVLAAPVMAVVAVAVKVTSPGPVFYVADRVGLGERAFRCYKFRTMREDAEHRQAEFEHLNEADGAIFKIRDDPRVTPVGRWLRATSIDEMPQLINVLLGDMSLVGPRPLPMRDNRLLKSWHKQRHLVLPGMTGLWQVSGRSDAPFDTMISLDLHYVDQWSLWLDLLIVWRTVSALVVRRGAH